MYHGILINDAIWYIEMYHDTFCMENTNEQFPRKVFFTVVVTVVVTTLV